MDGTTPLLPLSAITESLVTTCRRHAHFVKYVTVSGYLHLGVDGNSEEQEKVIINEIISKEEGSSCSGSFFLKNLEPNKGRSHQQCNNFRKTNDSSPRMKRQIAQIPNTPPVPNCLFEHRSKQANRTFTLPEKSLPRPVFSSSTIVIKGASPPPNGTDADRGDQHSPIPATIAVDTSGRRSHSRSYGYKHRMFKSGQDRQRGKSASYPRHQKFLKSSASCPSNKSSLFRTPTNYASALSLRCTDLHLSIDHNFPQESNDSMVVNRYSSSAGLDSVSSDEEMSIKNTKQPLDLVPHCEETDVVFENTSPNNNQDVMESAKDVETVGQNKSASCSESKSVEFNQECFTFLPFSTNILSVWKENEQSNCPSFSNTAYSIPHCNSITSFNKEQLCKPIVKDPYGCSPTQQNRKRNKKRKRKSAMTGSFINEHDQSERSKSENQISCKNQNSYGRETSEQSKGDGSLSAHRQTVKGSGSETRSTVSSPSRLSSFLHSVVQALSRTGLYHQGYRNSGHQHMASCNSHRQSIGNAIELQHFTHASEHGSYIG